MAVNFDPAAGHDIYDGMDVRRNVEAARRVLDIAENVPALELRQEINEAWAEIRWQAAKIIRADPDA